MRALACQNVAFISRAFPSTEVALGIYFIFSYGYEPLRGTNFFSNSNKLKKLNDQRWVTNVLVCCRSCASKWFAWQRLLHQTNWRIWSRKRAKLLS